MSSVRLRVGEVPPNARDDIGTGVVRIDSTAMEELGVDEGDAVWVIGSGRTVCSVQKSYPADKGLGIVRMDGYTRKNAGTALSEKVDLSPADTHEAAKLILYPETDAEVDFNDDVGLSSDDLAVRFLSVDDLVVIGAEDLEYSARIHEPLEEDKWSFKDKSFKAIVQRIKPESDNEQLAYELGAETDIGLVNKSQGDAGSDEAEPMTSWSSSTQPPSSVGSDEDVIQPGDFVYLSLSKRSIQPTSRSYEMDYSRFEFVGLDRYPVLLGAAQVPEELTVSIVGQHVGDTGQIELFPPEANDWGTSPTGLSEELSEEMIDRLRDHDITTAWDFLQLEPEALGEITEGTSETPSRLRAIQDDMAEQLAGRRLLRYEIMDAYRWADGRGGEHSPDATNGASNDITEQGYPASTVDISSSATAWPMFRYGPARTGCPGDSGEPPKTEPAIRWEFETGGEIRSSPVVVDGTVYVGSDDGIVYAVDASDGTGLWEFRTGDCIRSSPAVVGETVYIGNQDGSLYAVDATDGTQQWDFDTKHNVESSPAVVDGTVYVGVTGTMISSSKHESLCAFGTDSGTQQWTLEGVERIHSSPAVTSNTVYVGSKNGKLYSVDTADGTKQWEFQTGNSVKSSPVPVNGTVYVGSEASRLYAVWGVDGTQQWRFDAEGKIRSSPAVVDGTVYVGSDDGRVYAVNAADGTQEWAADVGRREPSTPAIVDGTVYAGTENGTVCALDATDGTEQWAIEIDGRVRSSPAVADGTVYIGSDDGSLYAFE